MRRHHSLLRPQPRSASRVPGGDDETGARTARTQLLRTLRHHHQRAPLRTKTHLFHQNGTRLQLRPAHGTERHRRDHALRIQPRRLPRVQQRLHRQRVRALHHLQDRQRRAQHLRNLLQTRPQTKVRVQRERERTALRQPSHQTRRLSHRKVAHRTHRREEKVRGRRRLLRPVPERRCRRPNPLLQRTQRKRRRQSQTTHRTCAHRRRQIRVQKLAERHDRNGLPARRYALHTRRNHTRHHHEPTRHTQQNDLRANPRVRQVQIRVLRGAAGRVPLQRGHRGGTHEHAKVHGVQRQRHRTHDERHHRQNVRSTYLHRTNVLPKAQAQQRR